MPAYTSLNDLLQRYGEPMLRRATDRGEVATGVIDHSVVASAIDDAAAAIDGYLAGRYALPLTTVPPLIASLAAQIAIWHLHPYEPTEKITADYQAAMRSLRDISSGAIRLSINGISSATTNESAAQYTDRARPLTAEKLRGFI